MSKRYYRHEDGRITTRTLGPVDGPYEVMLPTPTGTVEITEAEALADLAVHEAHRQEQARELADAALAERADDYRELRRLGMSETTARRLTGYRGM